ncbi:ribonucleotide-diphosphate reductase subunit beta [Agriterribacter sp.]|uniref:ribonucleotide-diphosphate reductase subunit beta n=1 Tax=Agriterribacter sp. TaxID=2821509 RepID=UPI002C750B96|nr:ribonucleotide-diphosphate reductase subunit beta [Agriterribacter sp.]HRO45554.1 ribonucleotide-diphosphate reductase subunit beta [Agriterribacter sp.]HRQ17924.1 ribonucleotide-diphosphate reductase subunit beta [Agriterribacter sp.]
MGLFDKRVQYKPFEYPEVLRFSAAINKSFWVHSEVDFTADVQDFHAHLSVAEQNAIKNSLLAIAQIEVAVKSFWGNLYHHFPKPEMNGLGSTFAECEFRHSEAYSRLLEVLGYNNQFESLVEVPVMKERIQYLSAALQNAKSTDKKEYTVSLILFSLLIENVSLFSQFAIILAFTRFKGLMKNVSNIIAWTSVDEQIHANAGIFLINKLKEEYPEIFSPEMIDHVCAVVQQSIATEVRILEWIFGAGEIDIINKNDLTNFMKQRADDSLKQIGIPPIFNISAKEGAAMLWFEEEVFSNSLDDFFAKRPVEYTKFDKSISAYDLF